MSINVFLKTGLGLLGASITGFGGYELHNYLTSTLESKYSLLAETDNKWDQLVQKYGASSSPAKMENLEWGESENSQIQKEKLANHCKKILKTLLREDEEVLKKREKEIKDWCVEDASALKS